MFKTDAAVSELVNVGRLEIVRAIAAHAPDTKVIRENEDDVGFLC